MQERFFGGVMPEEHEKDTIDEEIREYMLTLSL